MGSATQNGVSSHVPAGRKGRILTGDRPTGLIIDGLTLGRMPPDMLKVVLTVPRIAVCTGRAADLEDVVGTGPHVRLLGKPFALEEFDSLLRWLSEPAART